MKIAFSQSKNTRSLKLRRLTSGSLLKLVFIGTAFGVIPFFIFCGIFALLGANTVIFNHQYVTGVKGLVTALIMAPFFTVFLTVVAWVVAYIGIRIIGRIKPITIKYISAESQDIA